MSPVIQKKRYEEQKALVLTAAASPDWCSGNLDPYHLDEMFEETPSLLEKFQQASKRA